MNQTSWSFIWSLPDWDSSSESGCHILLLIWMWLSDPSFHLNLAVRLFIWSMAVCFFISSRAIHLIFWGQPNSDSSSESGCHILLLIWIWLSDPSLHLDQTSWSFIWSQPNSDSSSESGSQILLLIWIWVSDPSLYLNQALWSIIWSLPDSDSHLNQAVISFSSPESHSHIFHLESVWFRWRIWIRLSDPSPHLNLAVRSFSSPEYGSHIHHLTSIRWSYPLWGVCQWASSSWGREWTSSSAMCLIQILNLNQAVRSISLSGLGCQFLQLQSSYQLLHLE